MKAQGIIFDILVHGLTAKPMSIGEISGGILHYAGVDIHPHMLISALALLVATGEAVQSGPSHDAYSTLYAKNTGAQ